MQPPPATARVHSVNIAVVARTFGADLGPSGIDKRPVSHRVRLIADGVEGDLVVNRQHHGGEFKAVYAYASEDAAWWSEAIGRECPPGVFGENLTTVGIDCSAARIGEIWRVGNALLRVTEPRIPCRVFAGFWERPGLVQEFTTVGRSGAYLAIEQAGEVTAGDTIECSQRPDHDVTIGMLFAARTGQGTTRDGVHAAYAWLSPKWRAWLDAGLSAGR